MQLINIYQAKTQLSKLIEKVIEGQEVIIGKAGKPVAKLIAYQKEKSPRKPGYWKGKIWLAADFDKESKKINQLFYG